MIYKIINCNGLYASRRYTPPRHVHGKDIKDWWAILDKNNKIIKVVWSFGKKPDIETTDTGNTHGKNARGIANNKNKNEKDIHGTN